MKYALLAYMLVFGIGIVAMAAAVVIGRLIGEKGDPASEHIIDVVIAGILFAGMVFLWRDTESPNLKLCWQLIAPLTGAYALWDSWQARTEALKNGDRLENPKQVAFTDYMTSILLMPSIALNIWYAFR